jgi:hypothetical protein
VSLHDALGDVEAEPYASSIIRVDLTKPLEDHFHLVRRDSLAGVADGEVQFIRDSFYADDNSPSLRRELDRVAQNVRENLEDPRWIEGSRRGRRHDLCHERDPPRRRLGLKGVHGLRDDLSGISNLTRHREDACLDTSNVDQVSDETVHPRPRALNALSVGENLLLVILLGLGIGDESREADHRTQHVSQVMADDA